MLENPVNCIKCDAEFERSKTLFTMFCHDCQEEMRLKEIDSYFIKGGIVKGKSIDDNTPCWMDVSEAAMMFEKQNDDGDKA